MTLALVFYSGGLNLSLTQREYHLKSYFHWPPCNPSCTKEEVIYQGSAWHELSVTASRTQPVFLKEVEWSFSLLRIFYTHTHALLPLFEATEQRTITIKLLLPSTKRPLFLTLCSPPLPPPPPPHPLLPPHTFHASISSIPPTNLPIPPALFCLCCDPPAPCSTQSNWPSPPLHILVVLARHKVL